MSRVRQSARKLWLWAMAGIPTDVPPHCCACRYTLDEVEEGNEEQKVCKACEHFKWVALVGIAIGWPPILMKARPAHSPFASRSVQTVRRALWPPRIHPGSRYLCGKSTHEQPLTY